MKLPQDSEGAKFSGFRFGTVHRAGFTATGASAATTTLPNVPGAVAILSTADCYFAMATTAATGDMLIPAWQLVWPVAIKGGESMAARGYSATGEFRVMELG